ncbi:(2Fe-2S)-binding protein [Streptomyces sp. NPDC052610]|uniref:(2Fe-2S)-binding protein n=1 Tax=Streptomyces sp. NPDC052610 TaxID=3154952 RepID=UPI00341A8F4A
MVLLLLVDLDPDLAALRPLGGFFLLHTTSHTTSHPTSHTTSHDTPHTTGADPDALPTLAQVYAGRASQVHPDPLGFRVRKVAEALGAREPRVAASVAHLGLAARLWSVALGCAALYGRAPDLDPRLLRWDPDAVTPYDLRLTDVRPRRPRPADADTVADALADAVQSAHLEPLAAALRARYRIAPGLLRGNAASALAGAARTLDGWSREHGRTDVADRARALTADLFTHPLLAGTGTLSGTAFRRRSCCLYYRLPGAGVCGDCCFTRPPRSSPRAASG